MARKLRLEFPGACYHVINRGNYRADLFKTEGARAAFETCLFEACQKSNWVLHAFVVMSNHYHLALETPEGNLAAGMQWLQATFANRFNKLRGERGHLFQGRYKALLVEEGGPLGQVCHYIHLNPVRAGIVSAVQIGGYRHSSFWYLARPKMRPAPLDFRTALREAGELADNPAGHRKYLEYLGWHATDGPAGKNKSYISLSKGWALGTQEFKSGLVRDHSLAAQTRAWESSGAKEIREYGWETLLDRTLRRLGQTRQTLEAGARAQPWKVALAIFLKENSQVSNGWLSAKFGDCRPAYLSRLVSQARLKKVPLRELELLRVKGAT